MDSIEQKVRIAIANDFALRAREAYSSNPGSIAAAKQAIVEFIDTKFDELVQSEDADADTAEEMSGRFKERMGNELSVDKLSQQVAEEWMRGVKFFEGEYETLNMTLSMTGKELPSDILQQYRKIIDYVQRRDNIVNALVSRAQEGGISSIDAQVIRAAVRAEYQKPEDLVRSLRELGESVTCLMGAITRLSTLAGFEDGGLATLLFDIGKVTVDKTLDLYEQTAVAADIKAIYGN